MAVADPRSFLHDAREMALGAWRRTAALEVEAASDELSAALAATRTAALLGWTRGQGFVIARLPAGGGPQADRGQADMPRWSAPCFISLRLLSLGLCLGRQRVESCTFCMLPHLRLALGADGCSSIAGLEACLNLGGLQERAGVIALPTGGMGTVAINHTCGVLLELSVARGKLGVDAARNAVQYGTGTTPREVLDGTAPQPRELQQLYAELSGAVAGVEHVSSPSRVSASLERFTAGFDPERRIVMPDGRVLEEESRETK
ncbi:putative conserved isoform A [Micractinium conductrix]|uniref:Conserved isoform A n=1 Tax=Micractinium conductrix TaxID=554055 RepID=A0A2P6VIE6_9CHLO|nr:putative conserved isoform A [Micractinium conductrix]|eukprot:PSC73850.1 putative conserved isoform A [Micractinium conductrix]